MLGEQLPQPQERPARHLPGEGACSGAGSEPEITSIVAGSRRCTRRPSGKPRPLGWKTSVWSFGCAPGARDVRARAPAAPRRGRRRPGRENVRMIGADGRERAVERGADEHVRRRPGREPADPHRRRQPFPRARRARDERGAREVAPRPRRRRSGRRGARRRSVTRLVRAVGVSHRDDRAPGSRSARSPARPAVGYTIVDLRNAAGVRVTRLARVSVRPSSQPSQRERCTVAVTCTFVPGAELHVGADHGRR